MLSYAVMSVNFIFEIAILIISVIIHEVSHGVAADLQGDPTARLEGRLTLNPIKHIDPLGSIVIPTLSYFFGGFIVGWAKPVPFNPYNLRNQRWGEAIVAVAGPLSNVCIALVFGLAIRFLPVGVLSPSLISILTLIVFINLILAIFNLVPIAPLDGSKILFSILPYSARGIRTFMEQYSLFLVLIFIFFLWKFILPIVYILFGLITGMAF